jgi:hypothetical protein
MKTIEQFNDKLSGILDALADNTLSDSVSNHLELEEFYLYFKHQFYVLNVDNINENDVSLLKEKNQLNYKIIGMKNITILKEKQTQNTENILFLVSLPNSYYLMKSHYFENQFSSRTDAIKASNIENLVKAIPLIKLSHDFTKSDMQTLMPYLEKERLEKSLNHLELNKNNVFKI